MWWCHNILGTIKRVKVFSEIKGTVVLTMCVCFFCFVCFFCLPGVSIEFLCFPRPEEPIEHVMSCLQALFTLLESPCAKAHIAQDQVKSKHGETTCEKEEIYLLLNAVCVVVCVTQFSHCIFVHHKEKELVIINCLSKIYYNLYD